MPRLGAKTRNQAEASTVFHVWPDLLEVGEGSSLADRCVVGRYCTMVLSR
jgi:hypothetical protein